MQKDATLSLRINSELKSEVEEILDNLGIPMTTAIIMYFKQIKMRNGLPFNPIVIERPKSYQEYTEEELADSIEESIKDHKNGKIYSIEDIKKEFK